VPVEKGEYAPAVHCLQARVYILMPTHSDRPRHPFAVGRRTFRRQMPLYIRQKRSI
jgi:hypothetical protein